MNLEQDNNSKDPMSLEYYFKDYGSEHLYIKKIIKIIIII